MLVLVVRCSRVPGPAAEQVLQSSLHLLAKPRAWLKAVSAWRMGNLLLCTEASVCVALGPPWVDFRGNVYYHIF